MYFDKDVPHMKGAVEILFEPKHRLDKPRSR